MSDKYKIRDNDKAYFITSTIVGWIDVFTRANHKMLIVQSLRHCIKNKGLSIYAWCLMPSHLHMVTCRWISMLIPIFGMLHDNQSV